MGFLRIRSFISSHRPLQIALGLSITAWFWIRPKLRFVAGAAWQARKRLFFWGFLTILGYFSLFYLPAVAWRVAEAGSRLPDIDASVVFFLFALAALVLCAAAFLAAFAAFAHVSWHFLSLARALDAQLARDFGDVKRQISRFYQQDPQEKKSEGGFYPATDEKLAEQEQIDMLRSMFPGTDEDELKELKEKGYGVEA